MTRQESPIQLAFHHRIATSLDIPAINDLMKISIAENMKPYLSAKEIKAAKETMGVAGITPPVEMIACLIQLLMLLASELCILSLLGQEKALAHYCLSLVKKLPAMQALTL